MKTLCSILLSCAIAGAALPAAAQTEFERHEAQQRFDEGNRLYASGKYDEARVKFLQAWAALKRPNVLFNLARAEQLAGRIVESARHYRDYLRMTDPKITASDRREAEDHLRAIDEGAGRLLVTAPAGAAVSVDGERLDDARLREPIETTPGHHTVTARLGERTSTKDVDAAAGAQVSVTVDFGAASGSGAAGHAHAVSPSPSGAEAKGAMTPPAEAPRTSFWGARSIGGLALAGAGGVLIGVGVGFKIDQGAKSDRADELGASLPPGACGGSTPSPTCRDFGAALETRNNDSANASAMFWIGVPAVIAGVALMASAAVWPRTVGASALRFVPSIGPGHAGALVSSSF